MYVIAHIVTYNLQTSQLQHALNDSCLSTRHKYNPPYSFPKITNTRQHINYTQYGNFTQYLCKCDKYEQA